MISQVPTISSMRNAVEGRDAGLLKSFYDENAILTIIDADHPPSHPKILTGAKAIGAFLDDVCSRGMTHTLDIGVLDKDKLAFVEGCQYRDSGARVVSSSVAELGPYGIIKQTIIQAWDK